MRTALTVLLLLALAPPVGAQSHAERSRTDDAWKPSIGLPLPQIGLPLPSIGLPLPSTGLPPARSERVERTERFERTDQRRSSGGAVLFVPSFGWPYPYWDLGTPQLRATSFVPPHPARLPRAVGTLRIQLESGIDPQIYIDGYYVGLYSDAIGGELSVDPGAHTLELHEDGYEPLRADIQVAQDVVVTYRAGLKWSEPVAVPVTENRSPLSPPPSPTTIYVIPGCYVGNVPPSEAMLPAACDPRDAIEFRPAR
jgi:PEGA domain-containing protein